MEENGGSSMLGRQEKICARGVYVYFIQSQPLAPIRFVCRPISLFYRATPPPICRVGLDRQEREEPIPTRCATIYRRAQQFPNEPQPPHTEFTRDLLQFQIATTPAMGITHEANRHAPTVKTNIALGAPPRTQTGGGSEVVQNTTASGAIAVWMMAGGAKQRLGSANFRRRA